MKKYRNKELKKFLRARKRVMYPDEFREFAKRMSKYFDLKGCKTEKCIKKRIKSKNSAKLNGLIKAGFPYRLLIESWINPHPIYKEILDISDEEYDMLIEKKRQSMSRLKELLKYI